MSKSSNSRQSAKVESRDYFTETTAGTGRKIPLLDRVCLQLDLTYSLTWFGRVACLAWYQPERAHPSPGLVMN